MSWRCGVRKLTACLVSAVLIALAVNPVPARADEPKTVEFVISDPRITQSSGLATDTDNDVYWTMNDVGDPGIVYALRADGSTKGVLRYDAQPADVESIAYVGGRLYVGETGGNREPRQTVVVRRFNQPRPDGSTQSFDTLRFTFPDGNKDTEAMLVGADGSMTFVSKGATGGGIYVSARQPSVGADNALTKVADAPQYVTDATHLPDGRIVLRSYVALFVLDPHDYHVVAQGPASGLVQSESVTVPLRGTGLLIGTEGVDSEVLRVSIPSGMANVPVISPSPTTSAVTATPSPEPVPDSENGTAWWSVGAGGVILLGVALGLRKVRERLVVRRNEPSDHGSGDEREDKSNG